VSVPITLTEAACAAVLCLYAVSTSRGADTPASAVAERHDVGAVRAYAAYRSSQAICDELSQGGQRDICFREAKATYIAKIVEAKVRPDAQARN